MEEFPDFLIKIILVGDKNVGITTLRANHTPSIINSNIKLTQGVDFFAKSFTLNNGKLCKIQFWNIENEERFDHLKGMFCLGAKGALIIYDITDKQSLKIIGKWVQHIRERTKHIPIFLVGNKADLEISRKVTKEKVNEIVKKYNLTSSIEISAKTGKNVEKMYYNLIEKSLVNFL